MTENLKKFLETVSKSEELRKKINTMTKEELLVLAKELGIELTEADFEKPDGELSDDELETVAGGDECYCVMGGGGTGDSNDKTCACVIAGGGYPQNGDYSENRAERCGCCLTGYGDDS